LAKKKKLTPKQRKFAAVALTPKITQIEAVKQAGYDVKDNKSASVVAAQLMRNPAVVARMDELIDDEFPDAGNEAIRYLKKKMRATDSTHKEILDCIDRIAKYKGWEAPKKSLSLRGTINDRFGKLPGEEE